MLRHLSILVFIVLLSCSCYTQISNLGAPFIKNYQRSIYKGGSQTWDIQQCSNGMMYFANNEGLLEFDGANWNVYSLPNSSVLRSIAQGENNRIYAGGYDELGYYVIGDMGGAEYYSLVDKLPEDQKDFGDVWKIYIHPDGIIFQTYHQLFILNGETVDIIKAPSLFHFSYMVNDEYYVNDMSKGLMRYALGKLFYLKGMEKLAGKEIWGIIPMDEKMVIVTASDGMFIYNGNDLEPITSETNDYLKKNQVYCTYYLPNGNIAFGTIQNGILFTNSKLESINFINKNDGLQNNTILCMDIDFLGNLWLGTDHGIDYLELNLPLSLISDKYNLSTGYAALIENDIAYFGTNQGLFSIKTDSTKASLQNDIKLIDETKGQVWSLQKFGNSIFCGHNNGVFLINGDKATRLSGATGCWVFRQVPGNPNKIIAGTYTGLQSYDFTNNNWAISSELEGYEQSSRRMEFDEDGSLWVTHGYKGVYRIFFNNSYDSILKVDFYNSKGTDLPGFVTSLSKIKNEIIFTSDKGILSFDYDKNEFIRNNYFNEIFNDIDVQSIYQDNKNNLWYFDFNKAGVMRLGEDGSYSNIEKPFLKLSGEFVDAFEFVYPYNDRNVIFGTERGFVHYDPKFQKNYSYNFNAYIISLKTEHFDSVLKYEDIKSQNIILDYESNDVEFLFSANDFENSEQIVYSTFLEGNDKAWSNWASRNIRNYTNLDEGQYSFSVKAKNIYGTISESETIEFSVLPPYYRSVNAYVFYGLLVLVLVFILILLTRRRFIKARIRSEKEQQEQFQKKEESLQRERLEAEKEIIRMRNDKLREGIKLKDKELANSTMQTLQKNKMLITLREELHILEQMITSETQKHGIMRLVRAINKEIDDEKQWHVFETHFESVHEEFLKRIKQTFPNLTPRELKLCAYLRMNISSKEISVLMNISTRGVEISRYRLRKKFGIPRQTNLTEFILSF